MNPENYLYVSALLFTIGASGVLIRRNAVVVFMCVELMLNACNLAFVTFARMHGNLDGQVIAFFTMVVAATEVVVGLAIIMTIFRTRHSASVDDADLLAIVATAPASATTAQGPLRAGIGSVPEPQGYALLCAGLGLLGVARRRGGFRFQAAGARPNEAR